MSAYLKFEMQKNNGPAFVKPGEITSFTIAPEGGTRLVTRQKQVYYIAEDIDEVDEMIKEFFDEIHNY